MSTDATRPSPAPTATDWTVPGLRLRDVTLPVPLDHDDPTSPRLELFARLVTAEGGEDRPWLVYLQGGPGSEAPRPLDASTPPWLPGPCASTAWCCWTSAAPAVPPPWA